MYINLPSDCLVCSYSDILRIKFLAVEGKYRRDEKEMNFIIDIAPGYFHLFPMCVLVS